MEKSNNINEIELKPIKYYDDIIEKYGDITREVFDKVFRYSDVIGKCVTSFKNWLTTTTEISLQNFFDYYLTNVTSAETFKRLAAAFGNLVKLPNRKSEMLDLLICHSIIETYRGGQFEISVIDYIKKQPNTKIIYLDNETMDLFDRKYGVDIIFEYENKTYFVQVKPVSFFLGKKETIVADRIDALNRIEELKKNYPQYKDAVLKFCVYNKMYNTFFTDKNSIFLDLDKQYFNEDTTAFKNKFFNKNEKFKKLCNLV